MLNELVDFGKKIRKPGESDALKQEFVSIDLIIDAEGNFVSFNAHDKIATRAEALTAKKGKARLLLDKAEEVLGFDAKKHELFLDKLKEYQDLASLRPVMRFYDASNSSGLAKAAAAFETEVQEKIRKENLAFLILGDSSRLHEQDDVVAAVIAKFEAAQQSKKTVNQKLCSLCGTADYPILDEPHGMIKKVPDGQTSGSALVSYNEKAFESYGLEGNKNSSICSACARNYVEGLNYLLGNGVLCTPEKGKPYFQYSNRKNLAPDTAILYWTKSLAPVPEVDLLEETKERQVDIVALIHSAASKPALVTDKSINLLLDSPYSASTAMLESVDADRFYSCILSGAAARIAVRSWLEITTPAMKQHIAAWFHDIAIRSYDSDTKTMVLRFCSLRELANACGIHRKKEQSGNVSYDLDKEDPFLGRAQTMLHYSALLGNIPPLILLDRLVRRIKAEGGRVTAARAALIKLIMNRHIQWQSTGALRMHTQLDPKNTDIAYVAGRIFAVLESLQAAAQGNDLNASIRDRFISSVSSTPASAFARLNKLSENHLTKLRGEKPGLAVFFDRKLDELFATMPEQKFPTIFSLEEQGRFFFGFRQQRQELFVHGSGEQSGSNVIIDTKGE